MAARTMHQAERLLWTCLRRRIWTCLRRRMTLPALAAVLLAAPALALAQAEQGSDPTLHASLKHPFRVVSVATGLRQPIAIAFPPDNSIIVAERGGAVRVIRNGKLDPMPIQGLPGIARGGQGGLLDLCMHPRFERNRWVYLAFAVAGDGGLGTRVVRATLAGGSLRDHLTVLDQARSEGSQRFGGRMSFLPDETLVIALGDRGQGDHAQPAQAWPARPSASRTTAACPRTTRSSAARARARRSSPSATGRAGAWRCNRERACCGRASRARAAATRSTSFTRRELRVAAHQLRHGCQRHADRLGPDPSRA